MKPGLELAELVLVEPLNSIELPTRFGQTCGSEHKIWMCPQYFPAFDEKDFAEVKPWSGLRPVSPDGIPYIGRTQRWKNLTLAIGHAMMGLSLAPATGRIVAEVLSGEKSSVKLGLMSADRFA